MNYIDDRKYSIVLLHYFDSGEPLFVTIAPFNRQIINRSVIVIEQFNDSESAINYLIENEEKLIKTMHK